MLVKCPDCGNEISDKAKQCPKCGKRKMSTGRKVFIGIAIFIFIAMYFDRISPKPSACDCMIVMGFAQGSAKDAAVRILGNSFNDNWRTKSYDDCKDSYYSSVKRWMNKNESSGMILDNFEDYLTEKCNE